MSEPPRTQTDHLDPGPANPPASGKGGTTSPDHNPVCPKPVCASGPAPCDSCRKRITKGGSMLATSSLFYRLSSRPSHQTFRLEPGASFDQHGKEAKIITYAEREKTTSPRTNPGGPPTTTKMATRNKSEEATSLQRRLSRRTTKPMASTMSTATTTTICAEGEPVALWRRLSGRQVLAFLVSSISVPTDVSRPPGSPP